ncbi:hypothetical protein Y886_07030 [Xanthomonas hyacinthi DSM 19077]|nr:hypothetical protein Y886_07030 [Xanthomonas hyacinthi DSM 19077]
MIIRGPQRITIGKRELRHSDSAERRLCGHSWIGPSAWPDQSVARSSSPVALLAGSQTGGGEQS